MLVLYVSVNLNWTILSTICMRDPLKISTSFSHHTRMRYFWIYLGKWMRMDVVRRGAKRNANDRKRPQKVLRCWVEEEHWEDDPWEFQWWWHSTRLLLIYTPLYFVQLSLMWQFLHRDKKKNREWVLWVKKRGNDSGETNSACGRKPTQWGTFWDVVTSMKASSASTTFSCWRDEDEHKNRVLYPHPKTCIQSRFNLLLTVMYITFFFNWINTYLYLLRVA